MDGIFKDVFELVELGDLLVFNNMWVILVCMFGCKVSGGKLEVLVECMFDEYMILVYVCLLKLFKLGIEFYLGENDEFYVVM